jgi:hypothetical protein
VASAAATPATAAPSVTATHTLVLNGPIFIALRVFGYGVPVAAAIVAIDALRRPPSDFGGSATKRWMWAAPQLVLLAMLALVWLVRALDAALAGLVVLLLFLAFAVQIAYVFRVVLPNWRGRGGR